MRRSSSILFTLLLLVRSASPQTATDLDEGLRVNDDPINRQRTLSWWGRGGRTYVVQHSLDLLSWDYTVPVRYGGNAPLFHGLDSTAACGFFRLRFSDNASDYDGDRISNAQEAANGTDPWSSADSDFDGLPDDWENVWFGNLSHSGEEEAAGGLTVREKFEMGLDPNKADYDDDGVEDGADHFPTDERRSESIPVRYIMA